MKVIPKRTFLVRQEHTGAGRKKDIIARKGEKIEMSEEEAIKFWGSLELSEAEKKSLNAVARANDFKRLV